MTTPNPYESGAKGASGNEATVASVAEQITAGLLAPKAGLKTTELYVAVLTVADDLLLARYGHDWGLKGNLPVVAAIASSVVGAVYVAARTWLKGKHVATVKAG